MAEVTSSLAPSPLPPPLLVTDFDGTLYRGDDPIRHYARRAARELAPDRRRIVLDGVDQYLAMGAAASAVPEAIDGWEAVMLLARRLGVDPDALQAAFTDTRVHMLSEACSLEVPSGYAELLQQLRAGGVRVVLATNSPAAGLDPLLRRLDLLPLVDEVVAGTGKPAGLRRLLQRELGGAGAVGAAGLAPERVLVIGDHWRNDIEPGTDIGAFGAYIDRFGRADGPADATATTVEGLLEPIRKWEATAVPTTAPAAPTTPAPLLKALPSETS
ncbi:HAD family hydrolase [Streptacidiphilus sp. N1-10]|uniref:HAD family hydrolase n=1 Tax=Streptacidiphilus jeojiensis TaxID=3229225 RepID=A0ABV6Y0K1_9ACTN